MKRWTILLVSLAAVFCLASCGAGPQEAAQEKEAPSADTTTEPKQEKPKAKPQEESKPGPQEEPEEEPEEEPQEEPEEEPEEIPGNVLEVLPSEFVFASGAGGWATEMNLASDGSFTGEYTDFGYDEDENGEPQQYCDISRFSGQFSTPQKVSAYSYSMQLESLNLQDEPGTEYYEDDVRCVCTEPYGFENAGEFMIYLPGAPPEHRCQNCRRNFCLGSMRR